jgi:hypothetical protein
MTSLPFCLIAQREFSSAEDRIRSAPDFGHRVPMYFVCTKLRLARRIHSPLNETQARRLQPVEQRVTPRKRDELNDRFDVSADEEDAER